MLCLNACKLNETNFLPNEELELCFSPEFDKELDKLVTAMDKHIRRVKRFDNFIDYVHQYYTESPNLDDFDEEELKLGKYLNDTEFKKLCFDFFYLQKGKRVTRADYEADTFRTAIKTDLSRDKTFLQCLSEQQDQNSFISEFLALDMSATSPIDFARWVYTHRHQPGYDESVAKKIIALECYLLIIEVLPSLKSLEMDCP